MADVCPDCGRPKAENGPDWNVGFQAAHTDEVAPECGRHLPSYWSEEAIPDCLHATVAYQKDSIRALESELTFARTTIADLSYQLGKAQGEAEGHRLVRVGLESELAETVPIRVQQSKGFCNWCNLDPAEHARLGCVHPWEQPAEPAPQGAPRHFRGTVATLESCADTPCEVCAYPLAKHIGYGLPCPPAGEVVK